MKKCVFFLPFSIILLTCSTLLQANPHKQISSDQEIFRLTKAESEKADNLFDEYILLTNEYIGILEKSIQNELMDSMDGDRIVVLVQELGKIIQNADFQVELANSEEKMERFQQSITLLENKLKKLQEIFQ